MTKKELIDDLKEFVGATQSTDENKKHLITAWFEYELNVNEAKRLLNELENDYSIIAASQKG